jgi:hypothetical protein
MFGENSSKVSAFENCSSHCLTNCHDGFHRYSAAFTHLLPASKRDQKASYISNELVIHFARGTHVYTALATFPLAVFLHSYGPFHKYIQKAHTTHTAH